MGTRLKVSGKWKTAKKKPSNAKRWKKCKFHKIWVSPHSFKNCRCRGCPFHG